MNGWDRLRHGGLLLDSQRLNQVAAHHPEPLPWFEERELRRQAALILDGSGEVPGFVAFVLEKVCGFSHKLGDWQRGTNVPADWGRAIVTGETVKPRQLWRGFQGGLLPVFLDAEKRIGLGRGRKVTSSVLQWLRAGTERLALITNGRQWRLVFAGLDFDAWCEWDLDLWFEEGALSPQVSALRRLLFPALWNQSDPDAPSLLLQAILDSRKGQAELSAVLGERVREAVELLVQSHGEVLKERCADVASAEIYRAAVRVVMRLVVVLFAESRELLPRDNALYHNAYGLTGLLEELERIAARGGNRLARSWNSWPRVLGLFRLVHTGSHHPSLPVPSYGGELFSPANIEAQDAMDGLSRALAVFESACYDRELLSDREVHRILERITRTHVKIRQGRSSTWMPSPVDFSDLSSEYIGILYEGLLDFELKTAPPGDPVVFLAVGNEPALPLSRLEAMTDRALKDLLEKMKDTSSSDEEEAEVTIEEETAPAEEADLAGDDVPDIEEDDKVLTTRTRAETWARRATEVGKLIRRPTGVMTPERRRQYEDAVSRKARQLVTKVILPGEWYLVRWGGTRKGSGTFYTRPGLAVPTVHRTLRPLAWDSTGSSWTPKKPEDILALKVCDPACGSGTFPVAALRFLTDSLYASLHHHQRITEDGDRSVVRLLSAATTPVAGSEERLGEELIPCRPDDPLIEPKLKAVLRRYVVERCIYGVDLDPLAVELCRLALWIETMDRTLPFSFLDHKIKRGNALIGAWFDSVRDYPVMAWQRKAGDEDHDRFVHHFRDYVSARGQNKGQTIRSGDPWAATLKEFCEKRVKPSLRDWLVGQHALFKDVEGISPESLHDEAAAALEEVHALPVQDTEMRARFYKDRISERPALQHLGEMFDTWCALWFWPLDRLDLAPLPAAFNRLPQDARTIVKHLRQEHTFFHWELEYPDVFAHQASGFDALIGNPPWETQKPNSKEFFSNIDPLYRTYGKQEALDHQRLYFERNAMDEFSWLAYIARYKALANWCKHVSSPYGDGSDGGEPFPLGQHGIDLYANWREHRAKRSGYIDPEHPFRHQGSGDINTYKMFLEQSHSLLRLDGRLGMLAPSSLYADREAFELRQLLLDRCRWGYLFAFENRERIFDIHRSAKFCVLVATKGGTTKSIGVAFMRQKVEDWANASTHISELLAEDIRVLSPDTLAFVESTSRNQLQILIEANRHGVMSQFEAPREWGLECGREFHMTDDAKMFPPVADWTKRNFHPTSVELWMDTSGNCALPLYEGRMIRSFDYCAQRWISGKGRQAVWEDVTFAAKQLGPQYLMDGSAAEASGKSRTGLKLGIVIVSSATNKRSLKCALIPPLPCGHSVYTLQSTPNEVWRLLYLETVLTSFAFDFILRARFVGNNISAHLLHQCPLPYVPDKSAAGVIEIIRSAANLSFISAIFTPAALLLMAELGIFVAPRSRQTAVTEAERLRLRCQLDAVSAVLYGLESKDMFWILRECDYPSTSVSSKDFARKLDPKGFWRIDKANDPELRHTVLTLVALHDLQQKIGECGGDSGKGIESFLRQNNGDGWMLPETIRLADYGLGHDDRSREYQSVANRLGPRFYDWQLSQETEESWRECQIHARNLLGEAGYRKLCSDIEAAGRNERPAVEVKREPSTTSYGKLFD